MTAEIETFADGRAAFFSARTPAWHRLGTVTPDALTAQDALVTAMLDWDVELHQVSTLIMDDEGVHTVEVPNRFATVRRHPATGEYDALGVVGPSYTPVQNRDAFAVLDNIVDESGAHFDTAGSLKRGRNVFMSMKMPDTMQFSNGDEVDLYLLATNSHDGSSSFTLAVTPVRVVCQNTLTLGLAQARRTFSLRHTSGIHGRVQQAREALALTWQYRDEFADEVERLIAADFTARQFESLVGALFPKQNDTKYSATRAANELEALMGLWNAPTQENIKGTKWAAYNAVVEYADWFAPVRGKKDADVRRAERTLTGAADDLKQRALSLLTV